MILISLLLLIFDQFTKWLAINFLEYPYYFIGDSIGLVLRFNPVGAFDLPVPGVWMVVITPLILILFGFFYIKTGQLDHFFHLILGAMIFAGGVGNFIDRMIHDGKVVDFIALGWYPIFNLADVYLTVGAALMLFYEVGRIGWQKN